MYSEIQKLTEIDLTGLQIGEKLIIYRGSSSFLTGPGAAGYVGEATVTEVKKRSALLQVERRQYSTANRTYYKTLVYRLRFKDARICRIPNGEPTMLYVHARSGRPTITAYFTFDEYLLVKKLLGEEAETPATPKSHRIALNALDRMAFHDSLRAQ